MFFVPNKKPLSCVLVLRNWNTLQVMGWFCFFAKVKHAPGDGWFCFLQKCSQRRFDMLVYLSYKDRFYNNLK